MLLLCSDGLWEALKPAELLEFLKFDVLEEGVEEMLLAAERKMKSASDNLSAICLRWKDRLTTELPLQAVTAHEASQQTLWDDAAKTLAAQHTDSSANARKTKSEDKSFDTALKDLETFIKGFEGKR
ncbi:MAG: hypothetical protein A2150_04115 [Candidatus Muproteobacteria bacterium RBG_16_64_11]|uniref:PPM-type phosphatase domain-containing protein n=1 Tax=Candidatus Muproteobacteria bacterium RBG_16_64_11 TaxID=1817758 RepID=A0A1F6TD06_9PROT|nr:MAG: hypothetical protein A2150_04115 [Candidatus Muproteobacteria bacterium RBG_16_64_11]